MYVNFTIGSLKSQSMQQRLPKYYKNVSRTATRTPKISSAMCSPRSFGHVGVFSVEKFDARTRFRFYCLKVKVEFDVCRWNQLVALPTVPTTAYVHVKMYLVVFISVV